MTTSRIETAASTGSPVGTEQRLKKGFSYPSMFALSFAHISPIVALYGVFALCVAAAGPGAWWSFVLVLGAQLLVALLFAELCSRWPFEGGIYQWSRRLVHEAYGWFAGWVLMWTLIITITAVAYGAAGFVPVVLGSQPFTPRSQLLLALALLAVGTVLNLLGRLALKVFLAASIAAEVIGSLGLGTVLLVSHREHGLGVLFHSGTGAGSGGFLWSGLLVAVAFTGYTYVGFDAAADAAEEAVDPSRDVPRAVVFSLVAVGLVVCYSSLALILSIPDFGAVLSGAVKDPVAETLSTQLGSGVTKPLFGLFIVGFMASLIAIQTSCSRIMWAFARADVLPAAPFLRRLSPGAALPRRTILTTGVLAAVLLLATQSNNLYSTLVAMSTGGFFVSFAMPVLALTWTRLKSRWVPGAFTLGRLGLPVSVVAAVWVVFEYLNIAWPRLPGMPWYQNYAVLLITFVVLALGGLTFLSVRGKVRAADRRVLPGQDDARRPTSASGEAPTSALPANRI